MKLPFNLGSKFSGKLKGSHLSGGLTGSLKGKLSLALSFGLTVIAILTGLVIYNEVNKVTQVQTNSDEIFGRIVRVNLSQYKVIEKQLGDYSSFQPSPVPGSDAFGPAPEDTVGH